MASKAKAFAVFLQRTFEELGRAELFTCVHEARHLECRNVVFLATEVRKVDVCHLVGEVAVDAACADWCCHVDVEVCVERRGLSEGGDEWTPLAKPVGAIHYD